MQATLVSLTAFVLGAHPCSAVKLESGAVLTDTAPDIAPQCFLSPPGTTYKFAAGRLFPKAPDDGGYYGPTMDSGAKCCAMCESFKNCSFFTYSAGGTTEKPLCYSKPGGCCFLNTAAAATGKSGGCAACVTGSTQALAKPCQVTATCCKNGTSCGGTNLWTSWTNTALPNATSANPGTMPYPKSKDLTGWLFKSGCNPGYGAGAGVPTGASADTFYPSWAADGNLYTPFTDGSVVDDVTGKSYRAQSEGGGPGGGHVTHGQAAIVGDDPFGLNITKVAQFVGSSGWPYIGRFPCGSLVYKGTWWYGTYYVPAYPNGPANGPGNVLTGGLLGPLVDFRHTAELSPTNPANASWVEPRMNATSAADNLFGEVGQLPDANGGPKRIKFGTPHWVDFGQELEHSPDGKAYIVGHGATSPGSTEMWMLGDQVYMARVLPTVADIDDKSKWEFYAGGHGASAKWVTGAAGVAAASPLVEFSNHTGSTTVTYFAGIKKYVMSICTVSTYNSGAGHDAPVMDGGNFDTYFLESNHITGPWSYVTYLSNFGPQVYFANHPSKFAARAADTSAKTFDAFLMFSANYDPGRRGGQALPNSAYHMNLQQARFTLSAAFSDKLETRYKEEEKQALAN